MKTWFNNWLELGFRCAAAVTAMLLALAASDATAATYTWTQTAGGAQNWTTGGNWDGGSAPIPGTGDTVDFSTVDILDTTLTLGANRTANIWKFGDLSGGQTWTVSGSTLTLGGTSANLDVGTATTISSILAVANGTTATATGSGALTLDTSNFALGGTSGSTTQTLNLVGLAGGFAYSNSSGSFVVSGANTASSGASSGVVYLAPSSAITASSFGVGSTAGNANNASTSINSGTLYLGTTATINASTITLGAKKAQGTVQYASGAGVTNPTLKIRGTDGTSRVTTMNVGVNTTNEYDTNNLWDLTSNITGVSTLDALVNTMVVGYSNRTTGDSSVNLTATFKMGGGELDANTIVVGKTNISPMNTTGTFTTGAGGTVKVGSLVIGDKNFTSGTRTLTGTFNLNGGADLYATTIQRGNNTSSGSAVRKFNWNDGTIHNLTGTDLTIGTVGESNPVTWTLASTGTRTFDIDASRTGAVNVALTGAGGLIKAGEGELTLSVANSYVGGTTLQAGTLNVSNSLVGDVVIEGGTLNLSGSVGGNVDIQAGLLNVTGTVGGSVTVGSGGTLGGNGTINTSLIFDAGAQLAFNTSNTLTYAGALQPVGFSGFSVANLIGLTSAVADGTYTLIAGDVSLDNVSNVGSANAYDLGDGKIAYFESGSLDLVVATIPEPATLGLISVMGIAMLLRRRIVRG